MQIENVLVLIGNEPGDRHRDNHLPSHAQQGGSGQVRLKDQSLSVDGDIAHRRQIIEIEIPPLYNVKL